MTEHIGPITMAQAEAIVHTITREGLREAVMTAVAKVGQAANVDPAVAAQRLVKAVTLHAMAHDWAGPQLDYAISYLTAVGRELQRQFEEIADQLVTGGVGVWCHRDSIPALYTAQGGCSSCHGEGTHTTLADAAADCTHGADCTTHPGAAGLHNYDGPQF